MALNPLVDYGIIYELTRALEKKPTAAMLKQEKKIKLTSKKK